MTYDIYFVGHKNKRFEENMYLLYKCPWSFMIVLLYMTFPGLEITLLKMKVN